MTGKGGGNTPHPIKRVRFAVLAWWCKTMIDLKDVADFRQGLERARQDLFQYVDEEVRKLAGRMDRLDAALSEYIRGVE